MSEFLSRIVDDAFAWSFPPLESASGSPVSLGETHVDDPNPDLCDEPEWREESVADERLPPPAAGAAWSEARPKAQPQPQLLSVYVLDRDSGISATQAECDEPLDDAEPPLPREPVVQDRNNAQSVVPLRSEGHGAIGGPPSEGIAQSSGVAQREEKQQTNSPGDTLADVHEERLCNYPGFPTQAPQLPVPRGPNEQVADSAPPVPHGEESPAEARQVISAALDPTVVRHRPPQDMAEVDIGVELSLRRSPRRLTPVNGNPPPAIRSTEVMPKPNGSRLPTEEVRRAPESPGLLPLRGSAIPKSNMVGPPNPVRQIRHLAAAVRGVADSEPAGKFAAPDGTAARARLITTDAATRTFDADSDNAKRAQSRQVDAERKERPLRRTAQEGQARPNVYIGQVEIIVEVPSEPAHVATPSRSVESSFDLGANFMRRL